MGSCTNVCHVLSKDMKTRKGYSQGSTVPLPCLTVWGVFTRDKKSQDKVSVREHFVMTDRDCTVFHFIVEGSAISDVTKIPPEVSSVLDIISFVCSQ